MQKKTIQSLLSVVLCFFATVSSPFCSAAERASTATIPIEEYLTLKRQNELTKVTTVEEVRIRGTFGKPLTLVFKGRCAGGLEPREVLKASRAYTISGCKGEALLDLQSGTVRLVPLARRFSLACELRSANGSELEMEVLNAFSFSGEVAGAEVITDPTGENGRRVVVTPVKKPSSAANVGQVTGVAKYRITVEPEEARFQYLFRLNNPSRGLRAYTIRWLNGEIVQKARGLASYEEGEEGTKFNLSPGENEIVVNGRYQGARFRPLLDSEQQYLLLESHPTLQLTMEGKARRITPNDPDLRPRFQNARLYLFGKRSDFTWTMRKLEVMEAMGYSISSAQYEYYVPEQGRPVVDARFAFNNQGTPEVAIDIPGTATYLEVNNQAQVLYKSTEGKLLVQLPAGESNVYLQYRPEKESGKLLAGSKVNLAKPSAVLSNVSVSLLTPAKWRVLIGASLLGARSDYDVGSLVFALLLGGLFFGAGTLWGFSRARTRALSVLGIFLGFLTAEAFALFAALAGLLVLLRYRRAILELFRARPLRTGLLILLALLPVAWLTVYLMSGMAGGARQMMGKGISQLNNVQSNQQPGAPRAELDEERDGGAAARLGASKNSPAGAGAGGEAAGEPAEAETVGAYQGLPAKIIIPYNVMRTSFTQTLIDQRAKVVLRSVLLSKAVLDILALCLLLACLTTLYGRRETILRWAWDGAR